MTPQAQDAHAAVLDALVRLGMLASGSRLPRTLAKDVRKDLAVVRSRLVVLEQERDDAARREREWSDAVEASEEAWLRFKQERDGALEALRGARDFIVAVAREPWDSTRGDLAVEGLKFVDRALAVSVADIPQEDTRDASECLAAGGEGCGCSYEPYDTGGFTLRRYLCEQQGDIPQEDTTT